MTVKELINLLVPYGPDTIVAIDAKRADMDYKNIEKVEGIDENYYVIITASEKGGI